MVLAQGRFADDAVVFPAQMSVVDGERDAGQPGGGGRSAALADGDFVLDVESERLGRFPGGPEDLAVGGQDEVVFKSTADVGVAAIRRG